LEHEDKSVTVYRKDSPQCEMILSESIPDQLLETMRI
jgi:hypothetical protein